VADAPTYRLPRSVEPKRYELTLTPDLAAATFAGEERVQVQVLEAVDTIVLNAIELTIHSAELIGIDGTILEGTVTLDETEERAAIALERTATPGEWTLHLTFTGILNDKLHGFYRSTLKDDDGSERTIATTQFEATDARRAFPCWDEPDFKATFKVTLIVDADQTAVSNGGVVEETDLGNGKRQVEFAETMPMSTYLVAFIVGPFQFTQPVDVDGVPLRVAAVPGREHLTGFAVEAGASALRFFAEYFGIPYPSDKLDLIAIPDFAFGAMENLGCVTFRETALLVDPEHASRLEFERVADVVAHEIAHMWFGDLVTMKWWNGIWLNEAFATFMELLAVDNFRPEWQRWVSFGLGKSSAMLTDGLASTRPVEFPVGRPEEAEAMFDVLTYQKGAAVLRMLEQYLGAEPFRQGIAQYLATHKYGNTETTDLWDAIEAASGEPARATMDSWIFQGGYPLISVETSPDGTQLHLSQRPFRYGEDTPAARWQVPISLRASVAGRIEQRRLLLTDESASLEFEGKVDWAVVNAGAWGFYRVRYAGDLLRNLVTNPASELTPLERVGLVSDTWASVLAGASPVVDFFELVRSMGDDDDPDVWTVILSPLSFLDRVVTDDDRPRLQSFVRALAGPAFGRLGWEPGASDSERTGTLRATLLQSLGTVGADPDVRAEAARRHTAYLEDRTALSADLVDAVVAVVANAGGEGEYTQLLDRFRHPSTPQEEVRYLTSLARFQVVPLLRRTLDLCLSGEVRTQNAPYTIGSVLTNRVGGKLAFEFLRDHWDEVHERFPDNSIPRMLEGIAVQASAELASEVHSFLADHPVKAQLLVKQILERLDVNVALAEREGAQLGSALEG
jgi:puromycin-sensitive aminopeptidase